MKIMAKKLYVFYFFCLMNIIFINSALAEQIKEIKIAGLIRVDKEYILDLITVKEQIEFNQSAIDKDIKTLYATDMFSDIKISFKNQILSINITENPMISSITVSGNSALKTDMINKEMTLKNRTPFSINKINLDIQRLTNLYYKTGYLGISIKYTVKKLDYNRINVFIDIQEGDKSVIRDVNFKGNKFYNSSELADVILTKPARWWRILNSADVYDKNRILYDGELLRQFYLENGYPNFIIISTYTEMLLSNNSFNVTYTVDEGERYKFGDNIISIKMKELLPYEDEIKKVIELDKSEWFRNSVLQQQLQVVKNKIASLGFQFVSVTTQMVYNDIAKRVDIVFVITEENRLFINRIDFKGNTRTRDYVIRRELKFFEGDAYSSDKINVANRNLYRTGYFQGITFQDTPAEEGKVDLGLTLEETSTGTISIGGGYSTLDRLTLEGGFSEANLFGTGKYFSINLNLAETSQSYSTSLTEPYFLGKELGATISIYRTDSGTDAFGFYNDSLYRNTEQGISTSIAYNLSNDWRESIGYTLFHRRISSLLGGLSQSIQEIAGSSIISKVSHSISYDGRNNALYPTKGFDSSLYTEYAGVFGNTYYIKNVAKLTWYYSIYEEVVLSSLLSTGNITGLFDHKVNIVDKFTMGGATLRGFSEGSTQGGIGPVDMLTGESIGGMFMYRASFQIDVPVPGVGNYGLLFHLFNDWGMVTDYSTNPDIIDNAKLRSSVGFGLSWKAPTGVISIDYGIPIIKQSTDKEQRFLLNFGTRL